MRVYKVSHLILALASLFMPITSFASDAAHLDLTNSAIGYICLFVFVIAYILIIMEEQIHLRKSKPILIASSIIWVLIAFAYQQHGYDDVVEHALRHNFLEYAELFFFLLVAMTYINAMIERRVFDVLRDWLVFKGFSYRALFWLTGILAFFISPIADNLTTALIMCAVVMTVAPDKPKFVSLACINIVVAANAGGAFSPFGDITTLMVWQKGILPFTEFFNLFIPSVVNFVVPAMIMQLAVPAGKPAETNEKTLPMKPGGMVIVALFLLTIVTAVLFHNFLQLPAAFGMMTGFGYLGIFGYILKRKHGFKDNQIDKNFPDGREEFGLEKEDQPFDFFNKISQAEWDTLFFFYGVIMAVGGLGLIGYLGIASEFMYNELGATQANILVGFLSSIVDNIPVMFAVLTMNPDMPEVQWLLVTLTAGVGGSMLSVGSAAGVALMGQARGMYTFFGHLKWTPVIALGYAASIYVHFWVNG